ncbi:hypothetical protein GCM10007301_03740 [Azorhizobium oxalatiphilum]|uniref:Uncharacterized protein n=1 Tax=Azorhizobium oxalatiphilum TaxID=980631 RepID=A0A917BLY6_9HYPH|nr:hypothetical protein [Azorhizobium oxalatiphilum]GGF47658.1 hypothetical protein GCM10007301_03740 [Azorhizobium oxalatiphilum]
MSALLLKQHIAQFGEAGGKPTPAPSEFHRPGAVGPMKPLYEPKPKVEAKPKADGTPARPVKEAPPDPAVVLAAAVEAAKAEAREAARIEFEAERARDAAAFESHLELVRQQWTTESATVLGESLKTALAEMEERIANATGRLLLPFLGEAVRAKATEDLIAQIARLLSDAHAPMLRIAGPQDLLDQLRNRCGEAGIEFVPTTEVDVRVTANDTIIETQLGAWSARLREALA